MRPARFLLRLQELKGAVRYVDGSVLVDTVRMRKDAEERERMRAASRINDLAMGWLVERVSACPEERRAARELEGIYEELGAVALGAKVIEKHFTLDNGRVGPDHWFSMDPKAMANLVREVRDLEAAMGNPRKRVLPREDEGRRIAIRSLSLARDMRRGERIAADDLRVVRPGYGISPLDREKILGLPLAVDLPKDSVLEWGHFK